MVSSKHDDRLYEERRDAYERGENNLTHARLYFDKVRRRSIKESGTEICIKTSNKTNEDSTTEPEQPVLYNCGHSRKRERERERERNIETFK